MSRFYGTLEGRAKTMATRRGDSGSGITTFAASWNGAIRVDVGTDHLGRETFVVQMVPWHGVGKTRLLSRGFLSRELQSTRDKRKKKREKAMRKARYEAEKKERAERAAKLAEEQANSMLESVEIAD